jgi:histidinol-phosphatase
VSHDDALAFALELAREAEREILPRFRRTAVERKADGTVVTAADREAEHAMRSRIAARFPEDAVLGEEHGRSGPENARRLWVLDPIDGTVWFTLGVPTFGTLVGVLEDREPVAGVIHFPALGETVYAALGNGCHWRLGEGAPQRVQVEPPVRLGAASVSAGGPQGSDILPAPDASVNLTALVRRLHAALDTVMKPWDIAALVPCVREAGGVATGLDGRDAGVVFGGSLLSSCDLGLHQQVLAALRS